MRDVVTGFYRGVLESLIAEGKIAPSDSVLVVCGGALDEEVMRQVGFESATITNVDSSATSLTQDAENLSYEADSFDIVIVHAGLHHCHSPHRALIEMYRVARKCAIAFEARDSFLMRVAVRCGLTMDYEINAISEDRLSGGVANSSIPNFIYRWTEREVRKTISSYDPARIHDFKFFHDLRLPIQRFTRSGNRLLRMIGLALEPLSGLFAKIAPKQCNEYAFAIFKTNQFHPWIKKP